MIKKCAVCGKEFIPYRSYQKYCSKKCRLYKNNRRKRIYIKSQHRSELSHKKEGKD